MAAQGEFTLGFFYDFDTYAAAVLGSFERVQALAIVDYETARQYIDPATAHANVFGMLPGGSAPNDFRQYFYLVIKFPGDTGRKTAIGLPWIDSSSIVLKQQGTAIVTLANVSPDAVTKIRRALASNGFTDITISFS